MIPDLVSVCLPVSGGPHEALDAILSILNQSYHHLELIIVDDGATDEMPALVDVRASVMS